jgi:SAM-dependent methyltransferase
MKWILKAIIQKIISWLPASQKINFLFQKYVTKGVRLSDDYFSDKLGHAVDHITYFNKHKKADSFTVLELGSGWYPVVPISLFLAGAEQTTSMDISALMNAESIQQTISKFLRWHKDGKLKDLEPFIKANRWEKLESLEGKPLTKTELLKAIHLQLQVKDARATDFKEGTFDLICSNNTFEHIYPYILKDILKEFQRVLKPQGIMSHFVDMSDHFAHLDSSITIYNFLKYSKKQWVRIDNTVQPQNRLRHKDYLAMYADLGISIVDEKLRPGNVEEVKTTSLHPDFKDYALEEIAVSHVHLVSSK